LPLLYVQETAAANGVTAMPTFLFFRNKTKIDLLRGADAGSLEEKIRKWYGSGEDNGDETAVKGQVSSTSSSRYLLKVLHVILSNLESPCSEVISNNDAAGPWLSTNSVSLIQSICGSNRLLDRKQLVLTSSLNIL